MLRIKYIELSIWGILTPVNVRVRGVTNNTLHARALLGRSGQQGRSLVSKLLPQGVTPSSGQ